MALFGPPIGKVNAILLNGKSEDELSVANADTLDGMDSTDFATTGDIPTDYGDVNGPESATNGNFPILDVTGKILSDSTYAPDDFATSIHDHTGTNATSFTIDQDHAQQGSRLILEKNSYGNLEVKDGYGNLVSIDCYSLSGYVNNSQKVGGVYGYKCFNILNVDGILNTPPGSPSHGMIYMVGINPSGSWEYKEPGETLFYNSSTSSWITIGNMDYIEEY